MWQGLAKIKGVTRKGRKREICGQTGHKAASTTLKDTTDEDPLHWYKMGSLAPFEGDFFLKFFSF